MVAEMTDDVAGGLPERFGYRPTGPPEFGPTAPRSLPALPEGYFRPTQVATTPSGPAVIAPESDPARWAASRVLDAMARGELEEAASWVVDGVTHDPTCPDVYQALHQLGAVAGRGGLHLFPFDAASEGGMGAARAGLLAGLGQLDEAVDLLAKAIAVDPGHPWAAAPWAASPQLPDRLAVPSFTLACSQVALALGNPVTQTQRQALEPFVRLVRDVVGRHRDDVRLLVVASGLARHVADIPDALAWAQEADRLHPSFATAVMLGYAFQAAGRLADAERAMYRGLREQPNNASLCVDLGEMLADDGRIEEGLAWLERALAVAPGHRRALASILRVRHRQDARVGHLLELAAMMNEAGQGTPGADDPAERILADACAGRPWLGEIPPPGGATVKLLRELADQQRPRRLEGSGITLPQPDPPSALIALQWALPGFTVEVEQIPSPDPRGPLHPVHHWVWRYAGTHARATAPEPSAAAGEAVTAVAACGWRHPLAAYAAADRVGRLPLPDLLGLLVHPPVPGSPGVPGWAVREPAQWVRAVQFWTCVGIARTDGEPWDSSERREALVDIAFGPEDWVCEAAVAALVVRAWADPSVRADVAGTVMNRLVAAADAGAQRKVPILKSLAAAALATPGLPDEGWSLAAALLTGRTPT